MPMQSRRPTLRNSLWLKLMGIFTIIIIIGFAVTFIVIEYATSSQFRRLVLADDVNQAQNLAYILTEYYERHDGWENIGALIQDEIAGQFPMAANSKYTAPGASSQDTRLKATAFARSRVTLAGESGIVIADTAGLLTGQFHPVEHLDQGVAIELKGKHIGTIMVGSMIEPVLNPLDRDFLHSVNLAVVLSEVATGVVALILGSIFFFHITSPVRELTAAVESIASGNLSKRVSIRSKDEIGRLGLAYNSMADSLARAERSRRRMVADIAHELRTPLTLIQGNLEAFIDGMYALNMENIVNIYDETLVVTRLLDDLRDLALAEAGKLPLDFDEVNVVRLAETVIERFKIYAHEREASITMDIPSHEPIVIGDFQRLSQAIGNLIANALAYTPKGGQVRVKVDNARATSLNGVRSVLISVSDDGPGIEREDFQRVFDRFYRTDKSRARKNGGSGLGLSITDRIIEAHGGAVRLESTVGQGSVFSILLPAKANKTLT